MKSIALSSYALPPQPAAAPVPPAQQPVTVPPPQPLPVEIAGPASQLSIAFSTQDPASMTAALRSFESQVLLNPELAAQGGRWLANAGRTQYRQLPAMIQVESLLGELRGGGDALCFWVAQSWAATEDHQRLAYLGEALSISWREVHTDAAVRFGCALVTSLAMIQTRLAATLMSRIESLISLPKALKTTVDKAAAWVDVGCIMTQLSPEAQMVLEERLGDPGRKWEWTGREARNLIKELRPHLAAPSKATPMLHTVLPPSAWLPEEPEGLDSSLPELPRVHGAHDRHDAFRFTLLPEPAAQKQFYRHRRLLVLASIMLLLTMIYGVINARRALTLRAMGSMPEIQVQYRI